MRLASCDARAEAAEKHLVALCYDVLLARVPKNCKFRAGAAEASPSTHLHSKIRTASRVVYARLPTCREITLIVTWEHFFTVVVVC